MAAAPLLCAGIIGYRCLRLTGVVGERRRAACGRRPRPRRLRPSPTTTDVRPRRLGIYGFGSAASLCTQVAIWRGWEVYGIARDEEHRAMARELGAVWAGESGDDPGVLYDAAIVFAPAGELAVDALRRLDKGGIVALGGIYSSPIPPIEYPWIYHERVVRSVANSTRQDARELLRDAALVPVVSRVQEYDLEQANEALLDLKEDRVRGSAVLRVAAGVLVVAAASLRVTQSAANGTSDSGAEQLTQTYAAALRGQAGDIASRARPTARRTRCDSAT